MMLTVGFIVAFGLAACIPMTLSLVALCRRDLRLWPGTLGTLWTVLLIETCQRWQGLPGHAVFHILAACSTLLTFASFASEKPVESS